VHSLVPEITAGCTLSLANHRNVNTYNFQAADTSIKEKLAVKILNREYLNKSNYRE
jgi:hypothetical protein